MNEKYWKWASEMRKVVDRIKRIDIQIAKLKSEKTFLTGKQESLAIQFSQIDSSFENTFAEKSLTESILEILKQSSIPLPVSEILHRITAGGYVSKSSDPYMSVYVVCGKLSKRGLIIETTDLGKKAFVRK